MSTPALSRLRRASDNQILAERLTPPFTPLRWEGAEAGVDIYGEVVDTNGRSYHTPNYRTPLVLLPSAEAAWKASKYEGGAYLTDLAGRGRHARLGSSEAPNSNEPLWLPHTGESYLYLPGVSDNGARGPNIALPNGIDYEIDIELESWAPPATNTFTNHRRGAGITAEIWRAYVNSAGNLGFNFYDASGTLLPPLQASEVGLSGRQKLRFRANPTTGVVSIERKVSGAWITMVSQTRAPWAMPSAVATLAIGGSNYQHTSEVTRGKVFRAILRNGVGGPVVADFDPARSAEPHTSFVDSVGNTWLLQRSAIGRYASLIDRSGFQLDTDDYFSVAGSVPGTLYVCRRDPGGVLVTDTISAAQPIVFGGATPTTNYRGLMVGAAPFNRVLSSAEKARLHREFLL